MNMLEVKTADLIGLALDMAVLIAIQDVPFDHETLSAFYRASQGYRFELIPKFSTDWSQGGPLIDRERVMVEPLNDGPRAGQWTAGYIDRIGVQYGATALESACRAIVAAKLGDVVSVPAELVAA